MEQISEALHLFGAEEAPPAEAHPLVARMIGHWQSLVPAPGRLPGRQHFDPMRVPDLLPNIWLIDVVDDDPRRYRIRLIGGAITAAGSPLRRGQFFGDAATPTEAEQAIAVFDRIVANKWANWRRGTSVLQHLEHIHALERVILPMASDGETVDLLLCFSVFYWRDGRVR